MLACYDTYNYCPRCEEPLEWREWQEPYEAWGSVILHDYAVPFCSDCGWDWEEDE